MDDGKMAGAKQGSDNNTTLIPCGFYKKREKEGIIGFLRMLGLQKVERIICLHLGPWILADRQKNNPHRLKTRRGLSPGVRTKEGLRHYWSLSCAAEVGPSLPESATSLSLSAPSSSFNESISEYWSQFVVPSIISPVS